MTEEEFLQRGPDSRILKLRTLSGDQQVIAPFRRQRRPPKLFYQNLGQLRVFLPNCLDERPQATLDRRMRVLDGREGIRRWGLSRVASEIQPLRAFGSILSMNPNLKVGSESRKLSEIFIREYRTLGQGYHGWVAHWISTPIPHRVLCEANPSIAGWT
ncbi:MAG: hypothetical protein HYZ53_08690 [Planctomycetes bacterium]|nr:hypothetical protein [Planctomycetota bacterium]